MIQHQRQGKRSKGESQNAGAHASGSRPGDRWRAFYLLPFTFCLFPFVTGGCAGGRSYKEHYYILEAVRPGQPRKADSDATLEVHRFGVDAAYAGKGLVYRPDEMQYETDHYRQFLIAPGTMITERTRRWLADAGLFGQVLPVGSRITPTHALEGNVTALYGDFADESNAAAVMEIRFFLLANAGGQEHVVFAQTYRAAMPVRDRMAKVFVEALNQSLVEILTRLEADLRKALAE